MSITIKAENISKKYLLRHESQAKYNSLRESISNKFSTIFSNTKAETSELFWALKDINFEINQGDRVGIIGRNGAGKSTLLKILSRITEPTTGKITIKGRVASLLEVGTGFHPELSGRENIFLNGSILGMSRMEIKKKFDEIVAFAEIEKFLDTPVKRYSSGMYVRLAFAVAAHLEPEILIVDEVLAVGDAQFQKKCLGKMQDVSNDGGRTVLFVSHNMSAVQKLCKKGLLLHNGNIIESGDITQVSSTYLTSGNMSESYVEFNINQKTSLGNPINLCIENLEGHQKNEIPVGSPFQIKVNFEINKKTEHFIIAIGINDLSGISIRTSYSSPMTIEPGRYEAIYKYDDIMLASGTYPLVLGLSTYEKSFFYKENVASIQISDLSDVAYDDRILRNSGVGFILNPLKVLIHKL